MQERRREQEVKCVLSEKLHVPLPPVHTVTSAYVNLLSCPPSDDAMLVA
jgi:hypothetical protein